MEPSIDPHARRFPPCVAARHRAKARVVVAHDHAPLRRTMISALKMDDYAVVEATSSEDVLAAAGCGRRLGLASGAMQGRLDVIVCDLWLPATQRSVETMPVLDELHELPPVVLIAARASLADLDVARRSRAAAVFVCPFDLDDLRTVVMNLVPHERG